MLVIMIKGMNSIELIKDYKRNIHKWYFIAAADIVFALIIAFVNFKVPDTVMMSLIILYCSIGTAYSKYCQDSWISFTV